MNKKKIELSNFDFNEFKAEALSQLKSGQSLTGKDGILTPLIKELFESVLEGKMEAHLTECHESGIPNRRNGKTTKTMKSTTGIFDLETPRDREGRFEPELVKKRVVGLWWLSVAGIWRHFGFLIKCTMVVLIIENQRLIQSNYFG